MNLAATYRTILSLACILACADDAQPPRGGAGAQGEGDLGDWRFTADTIGDTVIVRTVSGSVWDTVELVAELTVGQLHGPDEYTFGSIAAVTAGPNGSIYVMDRHARRIRHYRANGRHLRDIGREGGGPGEYELVIELATISDGTLIAWDVGNTRLNRYKANGAVLDNWWVGGGSFQESNNLLVDRYDHVYVYVLKRHSRDESERIAAGYARYDPTGLLVDTLIALPHISDPPYSGRFGAKRWALVHPSGRMITGTSDSYSFDLGLADGVLRIERAVEAVQFTAGEQEQWDRAMACQRSMTSGGIAWQEPPTPAAKPFYRELRVGSLGRIWVRLYTQAVDMDVAEGTRTSQYSCMPALRWREPHHVYDIFEPDGRYLGQVRLPRRARLLAMRGDNAWGVQLGDYDEEYVIRWRLEH